MRIDEHHQKDTDAKVVQAITAARYGGAENCKSSHEGSPHHGCFRPNQNGVEQENNNGQQAAFTRPKAPCK